MRTSKMRPRREGVLSGHPAAIAFGFLVVLAAAAAASPPPPPPPPQHAPDPAPRPPAGNDPARKTPPPVPPVGTAVPRAQLFVQALREDRPELADPFFFPQDAFRQVKAIGDPDRYFRHLLALYHEDLHALRGQLSDPAHAELIAFELSPARRWMERGQEANALPYWSMYKATVVIRDAGKEVRLPVRVMITWDGQWYVTHLTRMK